MACYLSGGVDSAAVLGIARRVSGGIPIDAFTVRFDHPDYDESVAAREMAASASLSFDRRTHAGNKRCNRDEAVIELPSHRQRETTLLECGRSVGLQLVRFDGPNLPMRRVRTFPGSRGRGTTRSR